MADLDTRLEEIRLNRQSLLTSCPQSSWPLEINQQSCPHPIMIPQKHLPKIEELHEALTLAVTNIVERWWMEKDARFPERMPVELQEESVLRVCTYLPI